MVLPALLYQVRE